MSGVCERCGADMRFVGRVQNADGGNHGHHNRVFRCSDCDREVLRG